MNLVQRRVHILELPLPTDITILRPEQVILKFPNGSTIDIGSLCYLIRQSSLGNSHTTAKRGKLVQTESISRQRIKDVRKLIAFISDKILFSYIRIATILDLVRRFVGFVNWSDNNGFHDLLNNQEVARNAVIQYTDYLNQKIAVAEISLRGAENQQKAAIRFFSEFFENDNFKIGIRIIRNYRWQRKGTQPPCELEIAKVLSLCESLFDGLTSLVLDKKSYPYSCQMPTYLNFPKDRLWIFPSLSWFIHPSKALDKRLSCLGFNYQNGKLNSLRQLNNLRLTPTSTKNNIEILQNAEKSLREANQNFRHTQRRNVAAIAFNAFIPLFLSQTGMNWAQFINLQWDDEFEVSSTAQLFRTIKWRAGGKECQFELPVAFMRKFKRFLELRTYILHSQQFEFLFFAIGDRGLGAPRLLKGHSLNNLSVTLSRISPDFEMITSREWRAAKSDWLIRNTDLSTTAKVLQNTEQTVLQAYTAGSETLHWQEMSNFLNQVSNAIITEKNNEGDLLQGATGQCLSYNSPVALDNIDELNKPNCLEPQNCIFCDKFRVHIDTIDVRKLLSCRYYIEKIVALFGNLEQQQESIVPTLSRIDLILDEIRSHNSELVENISQEIEEGELDNYWARKLEMFMELNWIS